MILVTVGSSTYPFDRLLRATDKLSVRDERVIAQIGYSSVCPRDAECFRLIPFCQLDQLIARARVVVTHAGVATIVQCLRRRKRPIVVPRVRELGEHIDDHQLLFGRKLAALGVASVIEDPAELDAGLVEACSSEPFPRLGISPQLRGELISVLSAAMLHKPCKRTSTRLARLQRGETAE